VRFRHPDGTVVHLAYGTNVHPAEDVDGLVDQLRTYGAGVRAALGVDRIGWGLWLPAMAAAELAGDPAGIDRFRTALDRHGLEVVTINAFPYERFHAPVVKHSVYRPDWSEAARLDYTIDCARVLVRLLPDDAVRGSISTLPLGWRSWWYADRQQVALDQLARLADELAKLAADTGGWCGWGWSPNRVRRRDDCRRRGTAGRPRRRPSGDMSGHLSPRHDLRGRLLGCRRVDPRRPADCQNAVFGGAARSNAVRPGDTYCTGRLRRGSVSAPGP
jgi:hypothetical protein